MFDLNSSTLSAAALFAMATSITPGPNNTMLLASGVNFGWTRTLPHLAGVSGGLLFILLLGALGIQQWLFQLHWLHETVKWLGAIYLSYLAWRLFRADASAPTGQDNRNKPMTFLEAAIFQWMNPKVWAMVFGFFSTYVPAQSSMPAAITLCVVFALVNFPCVGLWTFAGDRLNRWLHAGQRLKWFNRAMGLLLLSSVLVAIWSA
jgi:threonine/homoserine/homoserine lactone efflux protein